MSVRADFKVGDIVQIGSSGGKGKIIDIVKPLGTYCMYKVHTYHTGEIKSASKHELVKGLPDEIFLDLFDCFTSEDIEAITRSTIPFDNNSENVSNEPVSPSRSILCLPTATSVVPFEQSNNIDKVECLSNNPGPESKRFATLAYTPSEYRQMHRNKNTESKTKSHLKLIREFLANKDENRMLHVIPYEELDRYMQEFIMCVRQNDGSDYEPTTLRGMISSLDRYLMECGYGCSVARSREFGCTMATLQSKGKDLKKQGKGNKIKAANDITDSEVDQLYKAGELGNHCPMSSINTQWYNNTLHFGIRGGAMEHRQLKWGNITLGYCQVTKCEYLEFVERQTKTRTGIDTGNIRQQNPRLYATGLDRCPVKSYKLYAKHRPAKFSGADDPFYLSPVTHLRYPTDEERWFLSQPIGVNKLKDLMKVMAKNAGLSDQSSGKRLTNTSVRKRLCQKLLQNQVSDTQAVLITGHKNPASLNNYRVLSNHQQKNISDLLSGSKEQQNSFVECSSSTSTSTLSNSQNVSNQTSNSFVAHNIPSLSLFANANITGGTFHITIQNSDKN